MIDFKLTNTIEVRREKDLEYLQSRFADKNAIFTVEFMTHDMPSNQLFQLSKILPENVKLYSIEMTPYDISTSTISNGKKGSTVRYYSIKISATREELDRICEHAKPFLETGKDRERNETIEEAGKHNAYLNSIATKPIF